MSKPLLPSLKKGHGVQPIPAGVWDARKADELDKIREGLDVNPAETQVNSIPDVWARPLLFEMALFSSDKEDERHPLRQQILGEWRGLLAMLALKGIKNLNVLSAKKVEIQLKPNQANPTFLEALHKLVPEKTFAADTSWRHLYLFLFQIGHQTRPIGVTSPTTLVVTPTFYYNHIDQNKIPWFDGKILQDPINYLSELEKEALAGWLNSIKTKLTKHPGRDETILEKLAGLLQNFVSELNVEFNSTEGDTPLEIEKGSGIFFYLDKPAGAGKPKDSDVRLVASQNRNPKMPMLLVDKAIATDWGKQLKQINVSGSATLADIPANGIVKRNRIGSHKIDKAELWQPKELFTEKLFVIRGENAFPGARQESWIQGIKPQLNSEPVSIILPIVEELLEYLDEDDLLQRLKFHQGPNGEIIVQLRLTLGKDLDTGRDYEIKKTFARNEITDFYQIPTIEVFPKFEKEDWKTYYVAYLADNPKNTFQIRPWSSFSQKINDANSNNENWNWRFESAVEEAKILKIRNNPTAECLIWRLESYPNVMVCSAEDEKGKNQKAGLLLLKSSQRDLPLAKRTFTAGVDFGASGTSIYYRALDGEPELLSFKNRKLSVTSLSDQQKSQLFDFFLPPRDFETPILSILQNYNNQTTASYSPITNGHIYYVNDNALYTRDGKTDKLLPNPNNIFTNLKWSEDKQHNLYAEAFLTQMCLQTVAELIQEGASRINWKFSYPTAFSEKHLGNFEPIWKRITGKIGELTGIKSDDPLNMTESVAAAEFFRSKPQNASTTQGTVFVDIGGSTSDLSVWQSDKLLWQISLRYAGQDIFLNYLLEHPSILQEFGISLQSSSDLYAQIDVALRKDSEKIFGELAGGGFDGFDELKQHLALGLSGLFYYIGLGINCLRQQNIYVKPEMPHFYFAGNGSKMFRWLINGQTWGKNRLAKQFRTLFEHIFVKALDDDLNGNFELKMSERPKQEAAFGLVCDTKLQDTEKSKKVFAGESFIEGDKEYKWNEILDKERLTDSLQPPAKLEKLTEFILEFNDFAAKSDGIIRKFDYDEHKLNTVRGLLNNDLADLAREKDEQVVVQPIFVLALKHLMRD